MSHLWKLTRKSPAAAKRVFRALHPPCALFAKDATFVRCASQFSLKYHRPPSSTSCFRSKTASLMGTRALCSEKPTSNQSARSRKLALVLEAQSALMDYLHGTRGLPFTDAEHMSKKSPIFLRKVLDKIKGEEEVDHALRLFFRYEPINEFEPFFESLGLKPSEFTPFLPPNLMFLSDDSQMLEIYHALCNYGILRGNIGKMYKEAREIFGYELWVLCTKLRAYEVLGLSRSSVIKIVASSPQLLIGDVDKEFVRVLEGLEDIGIERDWIGSTLSEKNLYDWSKMLIALQFFVEIGFSKQEVGTLIRRHPDFLLNASGKTMFSMVLLLLKIGATRMELFDLLSQFPRVQLGVYTRNLWRGLTFLMEIEMDSEYIGHLFRTHRDMFGLCSLKRTTSILTYLNVGKKRLCKIIKEDPHQLEKYALGLKITPLPNSGQDERSLMGKRKFLLRLGFVDDSKEMKKALSVFRGKGDELQDRYDFLVKTGLDPNDVSNMIKIAPQILNQKIDVLDNKIQFLVNNVGYPLSSLVAFPQYMSYTVARVNLRVSMYNWLKDRGKAKPELALSSILACSEEIFAKRYINHHPKGPGVWEKFKKTLYNS